MKKIFFIIFILIFKFSFAESREKLVIGTSLDNPPLEFQKNGLAVGFEIDLIHNLADELGYEIQIIDMDFSSLIAALKSGKIDLAIAGINATEERKKNADFTREYYKDNFALISRDSNKINVMKDIENKVIGAQIGSINAAFLQEYKKEFNGNFNIHLTAKIPQLIEELKLSHIDAIIIDYLSAVNLKNSVKSIHISKLPFVQPAGVSIAFPIKSKYLAEFDEAINKFEKNGNLELLKDKWINNNSKTNNISKFKENFFYILQGAKTTFTFIFKVFIISFILSTILSLIYYRGNKIARILIDLHIIIMRGTPLLVQLSIIYFCVPILFKNIKLDAIDAGLITFILNSTAYLNVIIIGAISAIDKGQKEAAKALGVNEFYIFYKIILPQALKNSVSAIFNEFADLIKESSLLGVIGVMEITRRAQLVAAEDYDYITPLLIAAIFYFMMVNIVNLLIKIMGNRNDYIKKSK